MPDTAIYDIEIQNIMGLNTTLEQYKGSVMLIVNTASKCGFTKQYDDLQKLYDQYKDRNFVVLGFPANNFMNQEPGDNAEIADFCRINFGVNFPMFAKLSVRGKTIHPLYKYLTEKATNPEFSGKISWNFNKFLISPDGNIAGRFGSRTEPMDAEIVKAIEALLPNP